MEEKKDAKDVTFDDIRQGLERLEIKLVGYFVKSSSIPKAQQFETSRQLVSNLRREIEQRGEGNGILQENHQ